MASMLIPLLSLSLWQSPQQPALLCETPREACTFFTQYLGAFNRRDWAAFTATLDDSITVMFDRPAPPDRRDGRKAAEGLFRLVFPPPGTPAAEMPPAIVPKELRVQDYGNVVVFSFHIRVDGETARRTVVARKGPAGWRVVHIHGSSAAAIER